MNKLGWKPVTLSECMTALSQLLSPEENQELLSCSEKDLIFYHHSLGRYLRNHWDLWVGGELSEHLKMLGFIHPDDMSQTIIEEYWARENHYPSKLTEKIESYAAYWGSVKNQT